MRNFNKQRQIQPQITNINTNQHSKENCSVSNTNRAFGKDITNQVKYIEAAEKSGAINNPSNHAERQNLPVQGNHVTIKATFRMQRAKIQSMDDNLLKNCLNSNLQDNKSKNSLSKENNEMQDAFTQNNMFCQNNHKKQNNKIFKNNSKREGDGINVIDKNYEALMKINRLKNVQQQIPNLPPLRNHLNHKLSHGLINVNNIVINNLNLNKNSHNLNVCTFKGVNEGEIPQLHQNSSLSEYNMCLENNINRRILQINPTLNSISNPLLQTNNKHAVFNSNNDLHVHDENLLISDIHMETISSNEEDSLNNFIGTNFIRSPYCQEPHEEYLDEIYKNLLFEELYDSICDYMPFQDHINSRMRIILIEWLVDVSIKFKLKQDTVFLTVHLVDRFLSLRKITRVKYQLLAASCLFLACKFEEIYYPELRDIIYICDKAYSGNEIIQMESEILRTLEYKIVPVFPSRFLQIISSQLKLSKFENNLCNLMLELVNFDYDMIKVLPSLVACTTVYITFKIKKLPTEECNKLLEKFYNSNYFEKFPESKIKECAQGICALLDKINLNYFRKIKEKYSLREYCEVANFYYL
jgi:hypothetical protein